MGGRELGWKEEARLREEAEHLKRQEGERRSVFLRQRRIGPFPNGLRPSGPPARPGFDASLLVAFSWRIKKRGSAGLAMSSRDTDPLRKGFLKRLEALSSSTPGSASTPGKPAES